MKGELGITDQERLSGVEGMEGQDRRGSVCGEN